jgi:hypothetical protein
LRWRPIWLAAYVQEFDHPLAKNITLADFAF